MAEDAGIEQPTTPAADITDEQWDRVVAVSAALDYASSGIRINAICPGIIDTHMIERVFGNTPQGRQAVLDQEPIGRMGRPEQIAAAVLWLCSEEASFAVGHAMVIDGGQTA